MNFYSNDIRKVYTHKRIFIRLGLSFTQTTLDYIYAILSSFQIEAMRGILIMFMIFYPFLNFIAWVGILGFLDLKYHNLEYKNYKDFFGRNKKRNIQMAFVFALCQIFNLLPFYIYIQIYKNHHAIFTEQLVNLLELDKQQKRYMMNDEEKSFATFKTNEQQNRQETNNQNVIKSSSQNKQDKINQSAVFKRDVQSKQTINFNSMANKAIKLNKMLQGKPGILNAQNQMSNAQDTPQQSEITKENLRHFLSVNSQVQGNTNQDEVNSLNQLFRGKRPGSVQPPSHNINFRKNLKTQIAIEANCKFSIIAIVEESNFQMLFEVGEIMEMAFKSFPIFAIQLCNNILQNNWVLYWFTILYFIILLVRLFVVGFIFIKFLLLNDRMIKFLENVRYFNEEMGEDEIQMNKNYPMPSFIEINQLNTLKRMIDISQSAAQQVKEMSIFINGEVKQTELLYKGMNSTITKFFQLQKMLVNLENNKLGSKKASEIISFLIQSLTKCREITLFFDGNDLSEEDLNTIKTKFDNNLTYQKFYFQSEQMVILYDSTNSEVNFLAELQMFYRRFYYEFEDILNMDKSLREYSKTFLPAPPLESKDSPSPLQAAPFLDSKIPLSDNKIKQLYIIVPNHIVNAEEQKMLVKIFSDIHIGYLEVLLNFEDQGVQVKLQEDMLNYKFQMGFIITKRFSFFKNGKYLKYQDQKQSQFEIQLLLEGNKNCSQPLSIQGSKGLSKMLSNHTRHSDYELIIPDSIITNHGLILIAESISNFCQTLKLDLSNNMLGDLGSLALANKLQKLLKLNSFSLTLKQNKFLTGKSLEVICESLSKLTKLKTLYFDLQKMEMSNKTANKLFNTLQNFTNIENLTIILRENVLDPVQQLVVDMNKAFGTSEKQLVNEKGSFNLAKCLDNLVNLKYLHLDLCNSNIDQSGASFITKSLGNLVNLNQLHLNFSENYIKKAGIQQLSMSIKKLQNLQQLQLFLNQVKKQNNNIRRNRKYAIGEQRMQLESLMREEEKPLNVIFRKIAQFNKKQSELNKYVEQLEIGEELTLKKFVALKINKEGQVDDYEKITKQQINKYLSEIMQQNIRAPQTTKRKLASFEDLFAKIQNLDKNRMTSLKLNLKSNGIINLDMKMLQAMIESLDCIKFISLNLSMNVITDQGVKFLFENISSNPSLKDVEFDLSSNIIKYEGAEYLGKMIIELANKHKKKNENQQKQDKENDQEEFNQSNNQDSINENSKVIPKLERFYLNIRNNSIEYMGGLALVEMADTLMDEDIEVILLMGNNDIVNLENQEQKNRYGYFQQLKLKLGVNFEYE
ncbi:hypothetical protein ABPG72_006110 [Tetrahymena utriculariae]